MVLKRQISVVVPTFDRLATLREALASCQEPRFRARAERALLLCAVDAPAANGLRAGLRADRTELKPDEVVQFTTTVCNVTDAPIRLLVGCSNSRDRALNSGAMLQRLEVETVLAQAAVLLRRRRPLRPVPVIPSTCRPPVPRPALARIMVWPHSSPHPVYG